MVDTPARMTLTEYAQRRGVSKMAVSKAVSSGRLTQSVIRDDKGRPWVVDPELADREWTRNTNFAQAPMYVQERAERTAPSAEHPVAPARDPSRGGRPPKARAPEPPRGESGPPVLGQSLAENNAAKAYWQAKREELEYRKKAGELVLAADVDAKVRNVFSVTRTKLLTLPSRAKTLLGLGAGQVLQLEDLTREMLEELAAGGAA